MKRFFAKVSHSLGGSFSEQPHAEEQPHQHHEECCPTCGQTTKECSCGECNSFNADSQTHLFEGVGTTLSFRDVVSQSTESTGPRVENSGTSYRVKDMKDFALFREFALAAGGWQLRARRNGVIVQTRNPGPEWGAKVSDLHLYRIFVDMPNIPPLQLYDAIHDPDYRRSWDDNMIDGYNICQLDAHNDIGYYSVKFPWPLANRDFCNMRSWVELSTGEFMIINNSVPHRDCAPQKGFVRASSLLSGYYIRPLPPHGNGTQLVFVTLSDMEGSIPHRLLNFFVVKGVPNLMDKLRTCAEKYRAWQVTRGVQNVVPPWRTDRISLEVPHAKPLQSVPAQGAQDRTSEESDTPQAQGE